MTDFLKDSGERPLLIVQSIPIGLNSWLEGNAVVTSGGTLTFNVTVFTGNSRLSLWNQLFSLRVDTNDNDHLFPAGTSLTSEQRSIRISQWIDFAESSDISNIRVHKIRIENFGASSHTIYLLYKAYTFASASGSGS